MSDGALTQQEIDEIINGTGLAMKTNSNSIGSIAEYANPLYNLEFSLPKTEELSKSVAQEICKILKEVVILQNSQIEELRNVVKNQQNEINKLRTLFRDSII